MIGHELDGDILQLLMNNSEYMSVFKEFQEETKWLSVRQEACLIALFTVVILIGLLGNGLVCYVFFKNDFLQIPRNVMIVNLAVCDILMCVFCLPFSLYKICNKTWHLGPTLCKITPSFQNVDVFVSTFSVVAIAIDRYRSIVSAPMDTLEHQRVLPGLICVWSLAFLCSVPVILYHSVENSYYGQVCLEVWPTSSLRAAYSISVMLIQYILPLGIISFTHARICSVLSSRIQRNPITEYEMKRVLRDIERHKRNMTLLTAISVTFAITWLPWTILNIAADFEAVFDHEDFMFWYGICLLVAMTSSCTNPIIYGWFNSNFKAAVKYSVFFWRRSSFESENTD